MKNDAQSQRKSFYVTLSEPFFPQGRRRRTPMQSSLLLGSSTHEELAPLLRDRHGLVISGASNETAKALLVSHILSHDDRPAVIVTENDSHADSLRHWMDFFGHSSFRVRYATEESGEVTTEQLSSILRLLKSDGIAILTQEVWNTDLPYFAELSKKKLTLSVGEAVDFNELFTLLIERGYSHAEDRDLLPGEYRRIGDTLEIFPLGEENAYRLRFDFETVEKILRMNPDDPSKTEEAGKKLTMYPLTWESVAPLRDQFPEGALLVLDGLDEEKESEEIDTLLFTAFPRAEENHVHLRYLSVLKFYTLTDFLNDVRDKLRQEWTILVVTKRAEELRKILKEESIAFADGERREPGSVTIVSADEDALLPHSIQNPDLKCAMLTDREIFTLKKEAKQRSVQRLALEFVTSLQQGDFVVHMEHGIGRFEGMTQKIVDDLAREYLDISYAEGDKLFVPVDQADKLSKFVYEEGEEPSLTRLGSADWKRLTKKISEETRKVAKELLDLYAKRAKAKGFAYPEDTKEQYEFEKAFPYKETPGQLKAIEDIKSDMESEYPMDRLVCGDVGFGKTEVAMRAAFKAVQAGKQVAFVSPITILADQHYQSLLKRTEGFKVRIDMMSRFRSATEQRETLARLRKGEIDILVGTHRLLQDDVEFFNLGLVIIDEEQRFGVKQKEKLKSLRASVDILTLTATPIPRTLNLGLHKLRDITTITTPPPGRLPIITEVRKYSDSLMRQAIEAELKRDGQVYVLHNRVETIDAFAAKLRSFIPTASFAVTHGQLKPEVLEERIRAFKEGKHNVLVSSTIIENGIDLPRANTLIVNEAERFGLAQLYQLRGRVGRGKIQAHAYFLYHSQRLKDDAKKRLQAIVEASELGSGFQISMRDLEIRGAGEILGASQSGSMQTVGVSHYLRLLKQAVDNLQSGGTGEIEEEINVEILLPVEAFLPSFFIPEEEEKITVYQKLAGSENEEILEEFRKDLHEEYGELPRQVENLFRILTLKMACRRAGVTRVKAEEQTKRKEIVLTLAPRVTAKEIMQLVRLCPQWRISGSTLRIWFEELEKEAGKREWIQVLTEHVDALRKPKKEKK